MVNRAPHLVNSINTNFPVLTVMEASSSCELVRLEQEWHKALERADIAWLDQLLSDDWVITNGSGVLIFKGDVLKDLQSGATRFESSVPSSITVRLHGNAAVVTKISTDKTSYSGQPSLLIAKVVQNGPERSRARP